MSRWMTLPNLFTFVRLLLAPAAIYEILHHRGFAALVIFALASVTDIIDGYLARHMHSSTASGAFLDPIADKLLLTGVYIALAVADSVPWWLVAVILARDLLILCAAAIALVTTRLRAFPPSIWGKASTFFQISTAVFFLGRNAFQAPFLGAVAAAFVWPTLVLTIWSGIHYGWRGARLLRMD